jgi:starvation-inducible DNA-binding protein
VFADARAGRRRFNQHTPVVARDEAETPGLRVTSTRWRLGAGMRILIAWLQSPPTRSNGDFTHQYATQNSLSSNGKAVSIRTLNARLADAIDLALLTKQAHWNIKGPHFIALHEMFDTFRAEIDIHVDTMAERVAQLGATALGTSQVVAGASTLAPYPTNIYTCKEHLAALIDRYAGIAHAVRAAIDKTDEAGDADTADLLTAFSRELDKSLWFLEAHVQETE